MSRAASKTLELGEEVCQDIIAGWLDPAQSSSTLARKHGLKIADVYYVWEIAKGRGELPNVHRDVYHGKGIEHRLDYDGRPRINEDKMLEALRQHHPERMTVLTSA